MAKDNRVRPSKAGIRVNVRLPPFVYFRLIEIAEKHNVSLSVIMRAMLKKSLNDIIDDDGYEREQNLW